MCSDLKVSTIQPFTANVIDRGLTYEEKIKLIKEIDPKGVDSVLDLVG